MDELKRNVLLSIFLVVVLYAIGFLVYHYLEGWGLVDSIYFQTMTFTTIGYGDIVPETQMGKLFTVFISWVGISIAFYLLYTLSTYRERLLDQKVQTMFFKFPHVFEKIKKKAKKLKKKKKK